MQSFEKFIDTPIAHRGLHDEIREENSMSAFKAAIERGFAIETDVHLLRDGVVAVHHDNSLKRICGKDVRIESLTSSQLKDYPMTLGGEIIPTLPEMLALVDGRVPILIELKTICGWRNNDLVRAVLRDLKNYPHKDVIALQSFDPFAVRWCRRHQTEYPFGQLASALGEKGKTPKILNDIMGKLLVNKVSKPMFTSYDVASSPNKYIDKTHEKMPVLSWTVRTEEDIAVARKYADNVIFEKVSPDIIKKELPFK